MFSAGKKRSYVAGMILFMTNLIFGACSQSPGQSPDDGQPPVDLLPCLCEYGDIDLQAEAGLQAKLSVKPIQGDDGQVCCGGVGCLSEIEQEFERFRQESVLVVGQVVDSQDRAVPAARVSIGDTMGVTDSEGIFRIALDSRYNRWLRIEAEGFRSQLRSVYLTGRLSEHTLQLGPLIVRQKDQAPKKLLFAGDFMLGRRYMDPQGIYDEFEIPADDPTAWIQASNPAKGSRKVVSYIKPLFESVDWATVNLESVVTDRPDTPDLDKMHVYFTLPGSLAALKELGIGYVGLANNHVCDYQSAGFRDTVGHLDALGIVYTGAGRDKTAAFEARYVDIGANSLALLAMTSVGPGDTTSCAATDGGEGVADLSDLDSVRQIIAEQSQAGRLPIVQLHTGWEYTYKPNKRALGFMHAAVESGAGLVVAHHPHMAQGLSIHQGVLLMYSLGNFVFDQYRNETMLSYAAEVDLAPGGVVGADVIPVFIEDYAPRAATGPLAARLIRRMAEFSDPPSIALTQRSGRARIDLDPPVLPEIVSRVVKFSISIGPDGWSIVDLRGIARPAESLAKISTDSPDIKVRVGRDLLGFGDFEDIDIDEDLFELTRWELSGGSRSCTLALRGAGALCLQTDGSGSHVYSATAGLHDQVRLLSFSDASDTITLFGYLQASCADSTRAVVSLVREDGGIVGNQTYELVRNGTHPWTPFARDINLQTDHYAQAQAVRVSFRYSADQPVSAGRVVLDELAIISWEGDQQADPQTLHFVGQHAKDFLRITGPTGIHELELRLTHLPDDVCARAASVNREPRADDLFSQRR